MRKSKFLSVLLAGALMLNLAGCSGGSDAPAQTGGSDADAGAAEEQVYTLQLAYSAAESSPAGIAAAKTEELLEEKSGGRIQVDVYPNAQLGGDRELIESSQAGNLAMVTLTTAPMVNFIPELAVFDMPAALTDIKVAMDVLNGDGAFRQEINSMYNDAGFELVMMAPVGYRQMSSNVAVRDMSDFSGIKIRTMENKYHLAFWKALGANPSPLAFSELYIALQQGLVDAQENPYATVVSAKLYEQQDYIINTNHIMFINTTVMNKGVYESLPEDLQAVVDDVFAEIAQYSYDIGMSEDAKALELLKSEGLEIIDLSDEQFAQIQELAKPVYDMIREDIGTELVDSLLSEIDAAK